MIENATGGRSGDSYVRNSEGGICWDVKNTVNVVAINDGSAGTCSSNIGVPQNY
jgi:hypothetical protein